MPATKSRKKAAKKSKKSKKSTKAKASKSSKMAKTQDQVVAEAIGDELGLTSEQATKLVDNLDRLTKLMVAVRSPVSKLAREMEVRRRMAKLAPDIYGKPSLIRRALGAARSVIFGTGRGVKHVASGIVGIFKRNKNWDPNDPNTWSVTKLASEYQRVTGKKELTTA